MGGVKLLVDAIVGSGFKSYDEADRMTRLGLAQFSGNQWNESWEWDREALSRKSKDQLERFYRLRAW